MSASFERPVLLSEEHDVDSFDCGVEALNTFLKHHALQNQRNNSARTFVATRTDSREVVGFYSLCAASVDFEQTPERIRKGLARHEVPLVLLARLAVDTNCKGQGLGASLLQDAFLRFMNVQETIGARALLAHAKDAPAKAFYEKWGFVSTEGLPFHLYILTKTITTTLQAGGGKGQSPGTY
ncbi:MAG: GNAT family N-acetyltransferase [Fimbriimonas sp.]|nr:GNAT family N-acetyltransferase [Fimbriimonas sp.]